MSEFNLPIANLKIAVDAAPAELPFMKFNPGYTNQGVHDKSEPFSTVLERTQAKSRGTPKEPTAAEPGRRHESDRTSESTERPVDNVRDRDTSAGTGQKVVAEVSDRDKVQTDGNVAAGEPFSDPEAGGNGTAPGMIDENEAVDAILQAKSGLLLEALLAGLGGKPVVTGENLTAAANPSTVTVPVVQAPVNGAVANQLPQASVAVNLESAAVLDQFILSGQQSNVIAPVLNLEQTLSGNGPLQAASRSFGPEWTGLIEISDLLESTVGSRSGERLNLPPPQRQTQPSVWAPRQLENPREMLESQHLNRNESFNAEPSFDPARVRFMQVNVEQQQGTKIPESDVNQAQMFSRNLAGDSINNVNPAGTATDAVGPGQTRQAATIQQSLDRIGIKPEVIIQDVKQAVLKVAADGRSHARIVLHPPELGELVVRLESARNGTIRAEFTTMSPVVREVLESGLDKLLESLKSEGLTLEHAQVNIDLNLSAENGDAETEAGSLTGNNEEMETTTLDVEGNPFSSVEPLPEGATISVLA